MSKRCVSYTLQMEAPPVPLRAPMCHACIFMIGQEFLCRRETELATAYRSREMDVAGQWISSPVKDTAGTPTNCADVVVVERFLFPYPPLQLCIHPNGLDSDQQLCSLSLISPSYSLYFLSFWSYPPSFTPSFSVYLPGGTLIPLHLKFYM